MNLGGKTAIVTGGAQGLGKGICEGILEAGGQVVIADIESKGQDTANEFSQKYGAGRAVFVKCDVTDAEQLRNVFDVAKRTYGYIDIVANNAGIADEKKWEKMIDINFGGVVKGCNLAIEYMSKESGGRGGLIINTASTGGLTSVPFQIVYAGTKHAVVGITKSLALRDDAAKGGIRVCCICPSFFHSRLMNNEHVGKFIEQDISAGRMIKAVGTMEVSEVVKGFMKIVEWEDLNGGVVVVNPKGIKVIYPRTYKAHL